MAEPQVEKEKEDGVPVKTITIMPNGIVVKHGMNGNWRVGDFFDVDYTSFWLLDKARVNIQKYEASEQQSVEVVRQVKALSLPNKISNKVCCEKLYFYTPLYFSSTKHNKLTNKVFILRSEK